MLVHLVDFCCELVDAAAELAECVFNCLLRFMDPVKVRAQCAGLSGFALESSGRQSGSEMFRCGEQYIAQLDTSRTAGLDRRVSDQVKITDCFHRSGGVFRWICALTRENFAGSSFSVDGVILADAVTDL